MKLSQVSSLIGLFAISFTVALFPHSPAQSQQDPEFLCDNSGAYPSTIVRAPQHGDVTMIEWKSDHFANSGFSPESRCNKVSTKFQNAYKQGSLKFFTTGLVNRQSVICAVATKSSPCNNDNMLYTLKPGSDPHKTLKQMLDIRSGASSNALNETNNRVYVDFNALIEAKAQESADDSTNIQAESLF